MVMDMPSERTHLQDDQPLLTCVAVVCRDRPVLSELTHVLYSINSYIDVTEGQKLADIAECGSIALLNRVAARQAKKWSSLPLLIAQCYRQEEFAAAMHVMAKRGFLAGAKWLREVYFPRGKFFDAAKIAAVNGYAELLEWIYANFPEDQSTTLGELYEAARHGLMDVVRVIYANNGNTRLTVLL